MKFGLEFLFLSSYWKLLMEVHKSLIFFKFHFYFIYILSLIIAIFFIE